jgi:hypothetical protein
MSSGSGADTIGDTRGVGLASMGISATGAAENSERNPRLFIPYLTNERAPRSYAAGAACTAPDTSLFPPSTVIRPLCQSATRSAAVATLELCASISLPVQPMVRPLPVPTAQHSRNRWSASSVEDPSAATASSTNSIPSIGRRGPFPHLQPRSAGPSAGTRAPPPRDLMVEPDQSPLDPLCRPGVQALVHIGTIRLDSASSNRNSRRFTAPNSWDIPSGLWMGGLLDATICEGIAWVNLAAWIG